MTPLQPSGSDDVYRFTEVELRQAEQEAEALEWHDIIDLYDDGELDYSQLHPSDWIPQPGETEDHPDNQHACHEDLCEDLNAQQRQNRRLSFARTKQRRRMSMKIALHRQSNPFKLKARSMAMARRILTKKILRGRSKSQLSPQEKNRLEKQLKNASPALFRIAQKVLPQVRKIEMTRLKHKVKKHHVREEVTKLPPEAFNNAEGPITIPSLEDINAAKAKAQLLYNVRNIKAKK